MIQTSEKPARRGNQRRRSCFSVSLRPPVVIRSAAFHLPFKLQYTDFDEVSQFSDHLAAGSATSCLESPVDGNRQINTEPFCRSLVLCPLRSVPRRCFPPARIVARTRFFK